jgi:hypothetical protein
VRRSAAHRFAPASRTSSAAGELVGGPDEDADVELEALADRLLEVRLETLRATATAREDRVAAQDVRPDAFVSEGAEELSQVGHGDLVPRPDVDPPEERDVGRH